MSRAPYLEAQTRDVQALLGTGFGWLQCSRFWLLTVGDVTQARAWITQLFKSRLIHSVRRMNKLGSQASSSVNEVATIAFSYAGLQAFGIRETDGFPFPTAFQSGMGSPLRAELLRDGDRAAWRWQDGSEGSECQTVHVLVAHWWRTCHATKFEPPAAPAFSAMRSLDGPPGYFKQPGQLNRPGHLKPPGHFTPPGHCQAHPRRPDKDVLVEPFGFVDGASQPTIWSLHDGTGDPVQTRRKSAGDFYRDDVVAPGEFILGYRNEYDELSYAPDVQGWRETGRATHRGGHFGLNGSYLAVRQIEQDVQAFRVMEAAAAALAPPGGGGPTFAEKLVGRHKDGTPLVPRRPSGLSAAVPPEPFTEVFRYRVDDRHGFGCPLGAHIRRSHPRDALGNEVQAGIFSAKLHRLIRRGRPYREVHSAALSPGVDGKPPQEAGKPTPVQGLMFMACNTDLERQFEFILQRWLHNPRFADLEDEDDPLLGTSTPPRRFTAPPGKAGLPTSLAAFTHTRGGGYFFLPGLRALRFVLSNGVTAAPITATPTHLAVPTAPITALPPAR